MADFAYGELLGGIGLFILGMMLMTDGLKTASGPALISFLEKYTNTKLKGFISGFVSTTVLQSSTATTLLAIGFVNTGILTFANSLWLLFGANVGSTVMPWIIAIMNNMSAGGGVAGFKISAFALPMIGIGIAMKMFKDKKKLTSLGGVVAGFGLLFLGLSFLQSAFTGIEELIPFESFMAWGIWSILLFVMIGFALTVIMQTSAAVMAVIITLATTAGLPLTMAAAAIIGANVGTTATAFFATIGATANAKRAAWAHILFNVVAGTTALLILAPFILSVDWFVDAVGMDDSIATQLALFHTAFNVLGALLMIPLSKYIAIGLSKFFTSSEVQVEQPQYLDKNLLSAPSLAIESVSKELDRYRDLLITSLRGFVSYVHGTSSVLPQINKLDELSKAITDFIMKLTESSMSDDVAERLTNCLKIRDQYSQSTEYLKQLTVVYKDAKHYKDPVKKQFMKFLDTVDELLGYIDTPVGAKPKSLSNRKLEDFDEIYKKFKSSLVRATVTENLSVRDMEDITTLARSLRGMIRSFAKAQKLVLPQED